jgi:hypothetical protein
VIAVVPSADLAAIVEGMRGAERIAGAVVAEAFDPRQLAAMAARIVDDDALGLERLLAPGAEIHTRAVADHAGKMRCLARLAAALDAQGVPRRYREPIEQCVDEMVMNALYDAPRDAEGKRLFAGTSVRERIGLRTQQRAIVRYAHDGRRFAVSVRDAFGALERDTVLAALHKCLHASQPVESRVEGAGLGLYLMLNASTAVQFCVVPGIATEVICLFDVAAPRLALTELGFFVQREPRGLRASGPARRLRVRRPKRIAAALGLAAALAGGVFAAMPRAPAPVAVVEIDSQPTGAEVEVDGAPAGTAPVTLTAVAPESTIAIVLRRTGYRPARVELRAPAAGSSARVVQPLERSDELVRVRFVSTPPGAEVTRTGQPPGADRTYTPAELFVDAGQVQRFTLTMTGRVPLVIEPFTPARGERDLEKGGALALGAPLHIEATLDGTVTVAGAPHCQGVALPAECVLAPGSHAIEYAGPDGSRIHRTVALTERGHTERFELGRVVAAPGEHLPGGAASAVLEAGTHTLTVSGPRGNHRVVVTVGPGTTVTAE